MKESGYGAALIAFLGLLLLCPKAQAGETISSSRASAADVLVADRTAATRPKVMQYPDYPGKGKADLDSPEIWNRVYAPPVSVEHSDWANNLSFVYPGRVLPGKLGEQYRMQMEEHRKRAPEMRRLPSEPGEAPTGEAPVEVHISPIRDLPSNYVDIKRVLREYWDREKFEKHTK